MTKARTGLDRSRIRRAGWTLSVLTIGWWGLQGGGGSDLSAAERAPVRKPAQRGSRPARVSAAAAPDIVLSGATAESRAVEARLAAFVRAVRGRNGARAVRFLSRQTAPRVRTAVARREWPWRTAPHDIGPLFAQPRLRLHTLDVRGPRARVRIVPQRIDSGSFRAIGFYDVGMVREGRRWQVRLPVSGR